MQQNDKVHVFVFESGTAMQLYLNWKNAFVFELTFGFEFYIAELYLYLIRKLVFGLNDGYVIIITITITFIDPK